MMNDDEEEVAPGEARRTFRRVLVKVMAVQLVTLLLLWLLQARYHPH